jgi:hypothetical protein
MGFMGERVVSDSKMLWPLSLWPRVGISHRRDVFDIDGILDIKLLTCDQSPGGAHFSGRSGMRASVCHD